MGAKSLADGHTKFTILTTKPADPENPTATELAAGIEASCDVLNSDFTWGPTDSDKVQEKPLCTEGNANAIGASNYQAGFTIFRYFDAATGKPDASAEDLLAAVQTKGSQLWGYARRTGQKAKEAWAADDEIFFGAEISTDNLQPPSDTGGYIKYRVPAEVQDGWTFIKVAAGA